MHENSADPEQSNGSIFASAREVNNYLKYYFEEFLFFFNPFRIGGYI